MAQDITNQLKQAQNLDRVMRNLSLSTGAFSSSLSSVLKNLAAANNETKEQSEIIEDVQQRMLEHLTMEEHKRKDIEKIIEKAGRERLSWLEKYKRKWQDVEKHTDNITKKMAAHFGVTLAHALQKFGQKLKEVFSLKGVWNLFKKGLVLATGALLGLGATAKIAGQAVYRHLRSGFDMAVNVVKKSASLVVSFFGKIWDVMTMGGGEIRQAVAEIAQSLGLFNGQMGQAMYFLQANRQQWRQMGIDVGEATKYVIELNKAYGHFLGFGKEAKDLYKDHIMFSRALGLDAEAAGKLGRSLSLMGSDMKHFGMTLVGTLGPSGPLSELGAFIPEIAKDIAETGNELALMGEQGRKTFITGAIWARQYNTSVKELMGMMDKFDTLSSAAENVSKLNQMFGVTINSMEMLVETDPAARLEKVQKSLLQAGKSWESMDYFQRKSLSSMMGIDAQQAQLVFSSKQLGKSRADIAKAMEEEDKRQAQSQQRQAQVMNEILKQLRASRGIMGSIMPIFYRLWVAFGQVFRKFLWGLRRGALEFVEGWAAGVRKLARSEEWKLATKNFVDMWRDSLSQVGKLWGNLWEQIDMKRFADDFYGTINIAIDAVKQILVDLFPDWAKSAQQGATAINDIIHGIAIRIQDVFRWLGNNGADIIRGIGKVAKGMYVIFKKVFDFFDKSSWGEAAGIMKNLFGVIVQDASKLLGYTSGIADNLLKFDPAVTSAKILSGLYMGMRDIVISIHDWWKRNADLIKSTISNVINSSKPYLELALNIGKAMGNIVAQMMSFLGKHPMLLQAVAYGAAINVMLQKLTGVGLGSLLSRLTGGAGGVQKVFVVNTGGGGGVAGVPYAGGGTLYGGLGSSRSTGIGDRMGGITTGMAANRLSVAGVGRTAGSAGMRGMLGYGIGSLAGGAVGSLFGNSAAGSAVGETAGSFAGVGSAIAGPLGGLVAGALGALSGVAVAAIQKENKEIAEHNARIRRMEEEHNQRYLNATMEELRNVINMIPVRQREIQELEKSLQLRGNEISALTINNQSIQDSWEAQDELLKVRLREARIIGDPEKIRAIEKEIENRQLLNDAIGTSIGFQQMMNHMQQVELQNKIKESEFAAERLRQEEIIRTSGEERARLIGERAGGDTIGGMRGLQDLSRLQDQQAITGAIDRMKEDIRNLGLLPEVQQKMLDTLETNLNMQVYGTEIGTARQNLANIFANITSAAEEAISAGQFNEAAEQQSKIAEARNVLASNDMQIAQGQLRIQQMEAKILQTRSKLLAENATPERINAAMAELATSFGVARPNIADVPHAFGGLATSATRALIGEAGPELVVPLRRGRVKSSPGAQSILKDYMNRMGNNESSKNNEKVVVIPINLDGRKIAEGLVRMSTRSA